VTRPVPAAILQITKSLILHMMLQKTRILTVSGPACDMTRMRRTYDDAKRQETCYVRNLLCHGDLSLEHFDRTNLKTVLHFKSSWAASRTPLESQRTRQNARATTVVFVCPKKTAVELETGRTARAHSVTFALIQNLFPFLRPVACVMTSRTQARQYIRARQSLK